MKKISYITILIIVALAMTLSAGAKTAIAGWHDMTQAQRNQSIINQAYYDKDIVGYNCKQWANLVVQHASGGVVSLLITAPEDYYWYASANVVGSSGMIEYASPGEIVQMELTSGGPHTAIILNVTSTHVTLTESNWCSPPTCNTVSTRIITFATFYGQVNNYTIYKIL